MFVHYQFLVMTPVIGNIRVKPNTLPSITRSVLLSKYGEEATKHIDYIFLRSLDPTGTLKAWISGRVIKSVLFPRTELDDTDILGGYVNEENVSYMTMFQTLKDGKQTSVTVEYIESSAKIDIYVSDKIIVDMNDKLNKTFAIGRYKSRGFGRVMLVKPSP